MVHSRPVPGALADSPLPLALRRLLEELRASRRFHAGEIVDAKVALLEEYARAFSLDGLVVGVSGGVDSAVTLGLCARARRPGSPIGRVVAVLAPMFVKAGATHQDDALARGRSAARAMGAEEVLVDLSAGLDAVKGAVDRGLGVTSGPWAAGQLVSYLRTPAFYSVVASLAEQGCRAVLVGTTNRSEGAYLGFFGKASDGMVDVQLISDLHKSEVYALAHELGVPRSIMDATPSGDTWDGAHDEQMIGAPYDFVELFQLASASGTDLDAAIEALAPVDAELARGWARAVRALHEKNLHKYIAGSPAVHLDVMERGVPGGWPLVQRREDPRPPASAFLGELALPAALVEGIASRSAVAARAPVGDFGHSGFVARGLLDAGEARALAEIAVEHAYVRVGIHGVRDGYDAARDPPGSRRASSWSPGLAAALWRRLAPCLPAARVIDAFTPTDDFGHAVWRPIGLNALFRFMVYDEGGLLVPHYDAGFDFGDDERVTLASVLIPLLGWQDEESPSAGGRTRLLLEPQRHLPLSRRSHDDDERQPEPFEVLHAHAPTPGDALVFDHRVRHDAEAWHGRGRRVVLRTDVVYERCGPPVKRGAPTVRARATHAAHPAERDRIYRAVLERFGEEGVVEAGWFDDGGSPDEPAPAHASPRWLGTPTHKLATPAADGELAVLVTTGGFCPVHAGHIAMMESARAALERRGVRVLGGYLAPDHDDYVRTKAGDHAPTAAHRIALCQHALLDSPWLMVDPWPALYAPRALNFTDVVLHLQAVVSRSVRSARPVRLYSVFGADNARFALAFLDEDIGAVCVGRPGAEDIFEKYRVDARLARARQVHFVNEGPGVHAASRAVRAGDDGALPARVRPIWRGWRAAPTGAPATRTARVSLRHEGRWAVEPWCAGRDEARLTAAYDRFVHGVAAELARAFRETSTPDVPHAATVELQHLDAQRARVAAELAGARVLSLDPCIPGDVHLALSRVFPVADQSGAPVVEARPGAPSLEAQLAALPAGDFVLLDDDIATGATLARVRELLPPRCRVTRTTFLVGSDSSDARGASYDVTDVVDGRDFLCGARMGGLVVRLPGDERARAPYLLPWVQPAQRVSVPIGSQKALSRAIWLLNEELFASLDVPVTVAEADPAVRILLTRAGFDPATDLARVARSYAEALR